MPTRYAIAVIVGSLRRESLNRTLAPAGASGHLRTTLAYLDMPTRGQPEVFLQAKDGLFDAGGNIGEKSRAFLQGWMNAYVARVEACTRKHAG